MGFNDVFKKITRPDDEDTGEIEAVRYDDIDDTGNKIVLLEPRAFSESKDIADILKRDNSVVVNLKRVTPEVAKRIIDFLSGTLYAINGELKKLGNGIFLCTPSTVKTDGVIGDDEINVKPGKNKNSDDDEFNF